MDSAQSTQQPVVVDDPALLEKTSGPAVANEVRRGIGIADLLMAEERRSVQEEKTCKLIEHCVPCSSVVSPTRTYKESKRKMGEYKRRCKRK